LVPDLRGYLPDAIETLRHALAERYRLERELGAGGMATVYLAEDIKHRRKVAVKVFRPELARVLGPERFLREVRTTAALDHPNILTLIDSGDAEGTLFYVMPYVAGESLRARLKREGALALEDALRLIQGAAAALEFAHRRGIVHRDIKPENILLHEGVPIVADFGIALTIGGAEVERLTETGYSLGTPAYMSPEQVTGTRELDGRSDQYSLACVLYELLAGKPPFTAPTAQGLFVKHVTEAAPPLRAARGDVPEAVDRAIERALAKDPADRYESMREFRSALHEPSPRIAQAEKSIVVLPFVNQSPDPGNEYFADGLTEELIADLSQVRALRVISRTSAMYFKGTNRPLKAIASELKVRHVLEGSVRKAGNSLRITAQLIDAETDAHLWADKYSGTIDDVFALQERLSREIVAALRIVLDPGESRQLGRTRIADPRAYDFYLRARHESLRGTPEGLDRALELLHHGIELIGDNELLYAAQAYAHWLHLGWAVDTSVERLREVERSIDNVFKANPSSAKGEMLRGLLAQRAGRLQEEVRHCKKALAFDPVEPDALALLTYAYALSGKMPEARATLAKTLAIDPLSVMARWAASFVPFAAGEFDSALDALVAAAAHDPDNPGLQGFRALCLAYLGRREEARDLFGNLEGRTTSLLLRGVFGFMASALAGDASGAVNCLSPGVIEAARADDNAALILADGFAALGDNDAALEWLRCQTLDHGFINWQFFTEHDPLLGHLREDPRFFELMAHVRRRWETFEV
jgi:serine/threonine protein kinase